MGALRTIALVFCVLSLLLAGFVSFSLCKAVFQADWRITMQCIRWLPGKGCTESMSMIMRWMAVTIFLALLVLPCLAQDAPRFSVSGGYSYWRLDTRPLGFSGATGLNGGKFAGTFNLTPHFGVVAEAGGGWSPHIKIYDGLVGPRLSFPKGSARFFGEGLFGRAKSHIDTNGGATSSSFIYGAGGGMDYDLTTHFAVRIEAQYLRTNLKFDQNNVRNNLQFSTGIVYHWGRVKAHKPKKLPKP